MKSKEKILITGATGFLGQALYNHYSREHQVIGTTRQNRPPFKQIELAYPALTARMIQAEKPDVVIHTAAMSDVDFCQAHQELAWGANLWPTAALAEGIKGTPTKLVYISTSYVFKGLKGEYTEADPPDPINWYGKTKLLAEKDLYKVLPTALTLRCDLLYTPNSLDGKVGLDNVQQRSPVLISDVAKAIDLLLELDQIGIFHVSGDERLTKYELGQKLGGDFRPLTDVKYAAPRPKKSSLDSTKIRSLGMVFTPTA